MNNRHLTLLIALVTIWTTIAQAQTTILLPKKTNNETINRLIDKMMPTEAGTIYFDSDGIPSMDRKGAVQAVMISEFMLSKFEITQQEWQTVMGRNPAKNKGMDRPIENISWDDCQAFLNKLNKMTGIRFSFPTESQWLYAELKGSKSKSLLWEFCRDWWYEPQVNEQLDLDASSRVENEIVRVYVVRRSADPEDREIMTDGTLKRENYGLRICVNLE